MPRKAIFKTRLPKIKVSTGRSRPQDAMDIEYWNDPMDIEDWIDPMDIEEWIDPMEIDDKEDPMEIDYVYDPEDIDPMIDIVGTNAHMIPVGKTGKYKLHQKHKHSEDVCGPASYSLSVDFQNNFACTNQQSNEELCNRYGKAARCHEIRKDGRIKEISPAFSNKQHKYAEKLAGTYAQSCANIINRRHSGVPPKHYKKDLAMADNICRREKIDAYGRRSTPNYTVEGLRTLIKQHGGNITSNGRYKTKEDLLKDLKKYTNKDY
jgi:hypothetical protein